MPRTFIRSQLTAIAATAVDFATTWLLLGFLPNGDTGTAIAVASGAVAGAVTACTVNHIWSFRGNGNPALAVALRYSVVWVGSLVLNTVGTVGLMHNFSMHNAQCTMHNLMMHDEQLVVMMAKAIVAVVVGVAWNYTLMKTWVYKRSQENAFEPKANK